MSTPVQPFNRSCGCGPQPAQGCPAGTQGPPGQQGPPPALAIGTVAQLPVGSNAQVQIRVNPAGGYFIDFALPNAAGALTQAAAEALFAKLLPEDGTYRVVTRDGSTYLEVWNPDQEKYQTVVIKGAPGHESIAVEAADA